MNHYFGRHAIVTIESTGSFITLKTYDAQHGNSTRMQTMLPVQSAPLHVRRCGCL